MDGGLLAWLDGDLRPERECPVPLDTHCLHHATGCFDGMRAYRRADGRTAIFQLRAHVERFFRSASAIGLEVPYAFDEVEAACVAVVDRNGLGDAYVRPLAFVGASISGFARANMQARVAVMAFPWSGPAEHDIAGGRPATLSPYPRSTALAPVYRAKACGNYLIATMSRLAAAKVGCSQSIFLDEHGRVCEAITDNLFFVKDGVVHTPSADLPIMAGLTRSAILDLLRAAGRVVREGVYLPRDLYDADELFTTSTAGGVQHIPRVDDHRIGSGAMGPVTRWARDAFTAAARGEPVAHRAPHEPLHDRHSMDQP